MDVVGRLAGLSVDLGELSPDDTPTLLAVKLFWSGTSCMSSGKGWASISAAGVAKRSADVRVMALIHKQPCDPEITLKVFAPCSLHVIITQMAGLNKVGFRRQPSWSV
jgi:hypothetical protein